MSERATELLDTRVSIETPEHVHFQFQLAGPTRRCFAYLLDLLARAALLLLLAIPAGLASVFDDGADGGGFRAGILLFALFVIEWGYFVASELWWRGSSLGKRVFGLRVVRQDGLPVRFNDSLIRNLLRAADFLPVGYAIGLVAMIVDQNFRRLGDLAAGTLVIHEAKPKLAAEVSLPKPLSANEAHKFPANFQLSNETLDALELFLRKRNELAPSREAELAELLAEPLSKRYGVRYKNATRLLEVAYQHARGATSVRRETFVKERMPRWRELDQSIVAERAAWSLPASSISRLASLYRAACADLMRASPGLHARPDPIPG